MSASLGLHNRTAAYWSYRPNDSLVPFVDGAVYDIEAYATVWLDEPTLHGVHIPGRLWYAVETVTILLSKSWGTSDEVLKEQVLLLQGDKAQRHPDQPLIGLNQSCADAAGMFLRVPSISLTGAT